MDPALRHAYVAARYVVETSEPITLKVGCVSEGLDAQLSRDGATRWAWLTAVNPGSVVLDAAENRDRLERLDAALREAGWRSYPGWSSDPEGRLAPEPSRLVVGMSASEARTLASTFGQTAILVGEVGGPVRLLACKESASDGIATSAIHAGEPSPRIGRAAIPPIFQSVVYEHAETGDDKTVLYPRYGNLPNHDAVHARLAALEGADDAHVTASGMAAVSAALLAATQPGGRVLLQRDLYGGTWAFVTRDLVEMGRSVTFVDAMQPGAFDAAWSPDVQAVYVEAMTNPLLRVVDHEAVIAFARARAVVAILDGTFVPPVLWKPCRLGYDLVVHSATKFLNGHSDLTAGVVVGRAALMEKVRGVVRRLGGSLDALNVWLLERGMKTLPLRVERACDNALRLALELASHRDVAAVHHVALPSHPDAAVARRLFGGRAALLAFEHRGGGAAAAAWLDALDLVTHGPSLGGVETLAVRPVTTSHRGVPPSERAAMGIHDGLIRVAVGIEEASDIWNDMRAAFAAVSP
ncbi:MAG: cystathionine gamma-synthase [Planctomycetota bacterium]